MADSNKQADHLHQFIQAHKDITLPSTSWLVVLEHTDQYKRLQQTMVESFKNENLDLHVFHSAEDCCDFVYSNVAENAPVAFMITVQLEYACKLIQDIGPTSEVQRILIFGHRPLSSEERTIIKACPKVCTHSRKVG